MLAIDCRGVIFIRQDPILKISIGIYCAGEFLEELDQEDDPRNFTPFNNTNTNTTGQDMSNNPPSNSIPSQANPNTNQNPINTNQNPNGQLLPDQNIPNMNLNFNGLGNLFGGPIQMTTTSTIGITGGSLGTTNGGNVQIFHTTLGKNIPNNIFLDLPRANANNQGINNIINNIMRFAGNLGVNE